MPKKKTVNTNISELENSSAKLNVEAVNAADEPAKAVETEAPTQAVEPVKTDETQAVENVETQAVEKAAEPAPENEESKSSDETKEAPVLRVEGLKKYFAIQTSFFGKPLKHLKAVDDVSFEVGRGKTIGVVGESGCGKTTLGRTILKLYESDGGKIYFDGVDITKLSKKQMMKYRTDMQLIFQDPYSSLPPRMTVGQIISEAVKVHKIVPKDQVYSYVHDIMKKCGLQPQYYDRYPHEFSGGQRQRICIARALAVKPKVVICDEPVSALDVSIQAQIINLLKELQVNMGFTYVFISHDLSVVKYITDSILVMYLGNAMEQGNTDDIFSNPLHPYTKALFSAVPVPDPTVKMNRIILEGDIPSPANPPEGCKFHTRCSQCMDVCKFKAPETIEVTRGHFVACHLYNKAVMDELDAYSAEFERLEEEKRIKLEEERIKKENAKLYRFKTKLVGLKTKFVGLFRRKKSDGAADGGNADPAVDTAAATDDNTVDATTDVTVESAATDNTVDATVDKPEEEA